MDDEGTSGVDEVMTGVGKAIEATVRGERDAARTILAALWAEVGGEQGDALRRLSIAHAMADVQDEPQDELAWERLALQSAQEVTDERVTEAGIHGPAAALFPSLHLNLADDYRKLGHMDAAGRHVALGLQTAVHLNDDGLRRLAGLLARPSQ